MGLRNKYSATDAYEEREDHRLVFAVPDGVEEVSIEVEDLLERSGPEFGYRLRAYRRVDFAPPRFERLTSTFLCAGRR